MIVTIIGARPQFVKAAILSAELAGQGIKEVIIHTGQHYDYKMSEVFFEELGLPGAEINLNIGSGSHGQQTAEMMVGIERFLLEKKDQVSLVLLYGDTNSTLAGALAASKLHIPIAHVEAGLRSFNKRMPEEVNRIMTDHLSSFLFCSSQVGRDNLYNEGIKSGVYISGDIMLDAFTIYSDIAKNKLDIRNILPSDVMDNYALLTIHRPDNTSNENRLAEIINAFEGLNEYVVWPVHPRNREIVKKILVPSNVYIFEPFSYLEMMLVLNNSKRVVTDSGGLQKEAYWAKKQCITVRPETEWIETLHDNWNMLVEVDKNLIRKALDSKVDPTKWYSLYGDAKTANHIAKALISENAIKK